MTQTGLGDWGEIYPGEYNPRTYRTPQPEAVQTTLGDWADE